MSDDGISDDAEHGPVPDLSPTTKLYRITEDDLASLEHVMPLIVDAMFTNINPRVATKLRLIKRILSDVRWGYGPPSHVERVDL